MVKWSNITPGSQAWRFSVSLTNDGQIGRQLSNPANGLSQQSAKTTRQLEMILMNIIMNRFIRIMPRETEYYSEDIRKTLICEKRFIFAR